MEEFGLRVSLLVRVRVRMPEVLLRLGGRLVAVRILVVRIFGERLPLGPVLEQVHEPVDEEARQREERDQPDEVFHPCIVCASSTFRVLRCRKSEIVSARPIAASPAAIVMTKTENTWPVRDDRRLENATRFRLTAFSISSTDIRTVRKLRRTRTPKNPIEKSRNETIRKWLIVIVISPLSRPNACRGRPPRSSQRAGRSRRSRTGAGSRGRATTRPPACCRRPSCRSPGKRPG